MVDLLPKHVTIQVGNEGLVSAMANRIAELEAALIDIAALDWHKFNDKNALRYAMDMHTIACAALTKIEPK